MANIIFYILIFSIGTVFGSFFTLAVYRIPLHQDITHERSYCPNCKHKLSFLDMIPILSYIFLRGRCRYCNSKIRIRYLLLEVLTGIIFVLITFSIKIDIINMQMDKIVYLSFILLYIAGIIIIAGIDKERKQINIPVVLYEVILLTIYMIYLYIVENANIYRYVIYLFIMCMFLLINIFTYKRKLRENYTLNLFILSIIISGFTYEWCFIYTTSLTLCFIAANIILEKIKYIKSNYTKITKNILANIPIGFYMCTSNIIVLIITNIIACRWY